MSAVAVAGCEGRACRRRRRAGRVRLVVQVERALAGQGERQDLDAGGAPSGSASSNDLQRDRLALHVLAFRTLKMLLSRKHAEHLGMAVDREGRPSRRCSSPATASTSPLVRITPDIGLSP